MSQPHDIQLIGSEIAIKWDDGHESFIPCPLLRAASPSAEVRGEPDIFGRIHGASGPRDHSGVSVVGWNRIGNYAIRFEFSDGHQTGLYTFDLLKRLGATPPAPGPR